MAEHRFDISIIVPTLNQGAFLERTLQSIDEQGLNSEIIIMDGDSSDNTKEILSKWEHKLAFWKSEKDDGQSHAINDGVSLATAEFVTWINSDDWLLPNSLEKLIQELQSKKDAPMVYGKTYDYIQAKNSFKDTWVEPFSEKRLAIRCIISQPGCLIRKRCWDDVGGLDRNLSMAFDYDLWWKLFKKFGQPIYFNEHVAVNRIHKLTKTNQNRFLHYKEAIEIVRKYYNSVPLKWYTYALYSVLYRSLLNKYHNLS